MTISRVIDQDEVFISTIDGVSVAVPKNLNRFHREILRWADAGGNIEPRHNVALTTDKASIMAGGIDEAVIAVAWADPGSPAPDRIDLVIVDGEGSLTVPVALVDGVGELPPITGDAADTVLVTVGGGHQYRAEPVVIEVANA